MLVVPAGVQVQLLTEQLQGVEDAGLIDPLAVIAKEESIAGWLRAIRSRQRA